MKIGLFYGTNTGVTEIVSEELKVVLEEKGFEVDLHDIADTPLDEMNNYENIIIATPTWNDGELQDDWEEVMDDFKEFDFSGKKVGFVGTGDQEAYCDNYLDALGVMSKPVLANGGTLFGRWPMDGYNYTKSLGKDENGMWYGLAIDNDNQEKLTPKRLKDWVDQIAKELEL